MRVVWPVSGEEGEEKLRVTFLLLKLLQVNIPRCHILEQLVLNSIKFTHIKLEGFHTSNLIDTASCHLKWWHLLYSPNNFSKTWYYKIFLVFSIYGYVVLTSFYFKSHFLDFWRVSSMYLLTFSVLSILNPSLNFI